MLRIHSQLQKIWNECFVVVAEKVHEKYKEKKKKKKTFCYFYGIKQIIFIASFTVWLLIVEGKRKIIIYC